MSASIGGSVGREGENREPDVELVQKLLAARGFDPGLADGICGPLTIGAIVSFQRGFLRQPDGLIEVGGTSWRRLTNGAGTPATPSPAADWSGDSARWPQEKKLASLNPPFWAKVETVLTRLRGRGFKPRIVFGWRSVAVQQELVRTGRSTVRFSFHNAQRPDGTPNAYAADIVDERWGWEPAAEENGYWEALGEEARALGLVWGGDWRTFKDVAHIQGRQNSELAATKRESGL
jgi:hypothetical protein